MTGITAYSAYIPRYRLSRKTVSAATGWLGQAAPLRGDKAVANFDEDSLTMAVAASTNCLPGTARDSIEGVYFATTTAPYREGDSAAIIATALNLTTGIRTAEFTGSLKAGTAALLSANDAVGSGSARNLLVCGADSQLGKAGGSAEMLFGDGGAAFVIGTEGVIASIEGSHSLTYDFPGHYRSKFDRYDRVLEDRFIREQGYSAFLPDAIDGLMKKYNLQPGDISKVAFPCLYKREHAKITKKLGFTEEQVQPSLLEAMGDAGAASPMLMLVGALDEAKPGDNIIVASYGSGSTVLWLKVTPAIERAKRGSLQAYLDSKQELVFYDKYAAFRGMLPMDVGARGEVGLTYLPVIWRDRDFITGLVGTRCRACGTPQLPPQRVCVNPDCGAIDEMDPYRFSDKNGSLFSYTEDNLAFSIHRPHSYGMVNFEGGGRYVLDLTDHESGALKVGMPVKCTFRLKYYDEFRGNHVYFWKAMPQRINTGG